MLRFDVLFDRLLRFLIVFLPWSTVVSVFLIYKIHIPGASFIKEGIMFVLFVLLMILSYRKYRDTRKNPFQFTWIDKLILAYIFVMVAVTISTTGISGLIYGGRYDFSFFLLYMVIYHGYEYLGKPLSYYLKLFLVSSGIMLFASGLLKYPFDEEFLIHFGYSPLASAWQFSDAPPIYHGIEGANVRRFQGLLDGPNTMGAFLLIFSGLFLYFNRYKKDWYFVMGMVVLVLVIMLLYTYSRSAILGFFAAFVILLISGIHILYTHYKKQVLVLGGIAFLLGGLIFMKYAGTAQAIIGREGSTKGHMERMNIGIERFLGAPLGQGMGSSGPAYRYVMNLEGLSREDVEAMDVQYIPESWYIQQFVEGGVIGGFLFLTIMLAFFLGLLFINPFLGAMFAGIGLMNFFLHTFESSMVSLPLFLLAGLIFADKKGTFRKYAKK